MLDTSSGVCASLTSASASGGRVPVGICGDSGVISRSLQVAFADRQCPAGTRLAAFHTIAHIVVRALGYFPLGCREHHADHHQTLRATGAVR
ncbi:hypothetical protein Acy02nite_81770 [Actinoplanes cyaneus]|uniref:Uncharacterized protein n=1 Tax=Actinoplanes cyaneus TaxID=52696 RepID=A0A919MGJ2_9ACTN|nr:hypothetical protein Acy02nite_81770 [Actinoplanes cyaneus]